MAQSPEYPDLAWMPPRSWSNSNRTSVQLVVIHTTEGSATAHSAEDGASYDQERTDGTSTHYFHDSTSTIQCVLTADQAHAARTQGNRRGIQHELCTRAGSADWNDAYHQAMLRRAAKQAARDAAKWGIPIRHLTVAQVADGVKGFCGHVDITYAFPQDNGTHTDPGADFPWSQFLDLVRGNGEDDMTTLDDLNNFFAPGTNTDGTPTSKIGRDAFNQGIPDPWTGGRSMAYQVVQKIGDSVRAMQTTQAAMAAQLTQLSGRDFTDEAAIATMVLSGLDLPALATSIADQVSAHLPDGVDVDPAQLQQAIIGALRELAAPPAQP